MADTKKKNKITCKFFQLEGGCKNLNCTFYHPNKKSSIEKKEIVIKKDKPCAFWAIGECQKGDKCAFNHPPRSPELKDILKYKSSEKKVPTNIESCMVSVSPKLRCGLPELPPNGKCRVMEQDGLVIYFIPFFKSIDGIVYFKKIRLFRYNHTKQEYKLVFSYTKQNFHITTASASNGYLVCSRLPYDPNVLKMMEEAKRLKKQTERLQQKLSQKDERMTNQIAKLKAKNRFLSDKIKDRPKVSELRVRVNVQVTASSKMQSLETKIFDNIRSQDPIDLFVFDPELKAHVHVLEYHKPADHVDLEGRTLRLWDKKSGFNHIFDIKLLTKDVATLDFDDPLQPKQLCEIF